LRGVDLIVWVGWVVVGWREGRKEGRKDGRYEKGGMV